MALLWVEGWDNYTDYTEILEDRRYHEEFSASSPTLVAGRSGGQALRLNNSSNEFRCYLDQNSTTTVFGGFAIKINTASTGGYYIVVFHDEFQTGKTIAISIDDEYFVSVGLSTDRSSNLVSCRLKEGKWHYVSYKIVFSNTVGEVYLYLDGALADSATNVDTIDSGSGNIRRINIESPSLWSIDIDDMYFGDNSGSDLTDVVHDVVVERIKPDGAGSSTQFTPSAGSNYQNVDEDTPDDDTTYNESSTAGHKDLFSVANLSSSTGTVYAVQNQYYANKQGVGTRTIRSKILSSATEGDGATTGLLDSAYLFNTDIFENDPNGGINWTPTSVNAVEIGYEIVD